MRKMPRSCGTRAGSPGVLQYHGGVELVAECAA